MSHTVAICRLVGIEHEGIALPCTRRGLSYAVVYRRHCHAPAKICNDETSCGRTELPSASMMVRMCLSTEKTKFGRPAPYSKIHKCGFNRDFALTAHRDQPKAVPGWRGWESIWQRCTTDRVTHRVPALTLTTASSLLVGPST